MLICDDAIFMRTMVGDILQQAGFEIVGEAETGLQAVEKYKQLRPDLVTMDIVMPDMGGIDAVREIVREGARDVATPEEWLEGADKQPGSWWPDWVRWLTSHAGDKVPAPLRILFTTAQDKAQVGADPEGRGFFVVKVDKIIPGNALNQPRLIAEVQTEFGEPLAQEYAQQLLASVVGAVIASAIFVSAAVGPVSQFI